jgi:hypothetical protein
LRFKAFLLTPSLQFIHLVLLSPAISHQKP